MDIKNALEAVTAIRSTVPGEEQHIFDAELAELASQLGLVSDNVGPLATTDTLTESEAAATDEVQTTAPDLTAEQHERASVLKVALAEKFSSSERTLSPEDFGVVVVGEGEDRQVVVMLTTGNGLYQGSYNTVMSDDETNKAKYLVEVNGQTIDTRKVMTWEVYKAFIIQAQAQAQGITPLPDSIALQAANGEPWTATWLTGEQPDGLNARYGDFYEGHPNRRWYNRRRDWLRVRVRPAAVV